MRKAVGYFCYSSRRYWPNSFNIPNLCNVILFIINPLVENIEDFLQPTTITARKTDGAICFDISLPNIQDGFHATFKHRQKDIHVLKMTRYYPSGGCTDVWYAERIDKPIKFHVSCVRQLRQKDFALMFRQTHLHFRFSEFYFVFWASVKISAGSLTQPRLKNSSICFSPSPSISNANETQNDLAVLRLRAEQINSSCATANRAFSFAAAGDLTSLTACCHKQGKHPGKFEFGSPPRAAFCPRLNHLRDHIACTLDE